MPPDFVPPASSWPSRRSWPPSCWSWPAGAEPGGSLRGRLRSSGEGDDRDGSGGLAPVAVENRVDGDQPRPGSLLVLDAERFGHPDLAPSAHFDLNLRLVEQVEVPGRMMIAPGVGGHDEVSVAVVEVHHRPRPRLPGAPAGGRQEEHGCLSESPADASPAEPVGVSVQGADHAGHGVGCRQGCYLQRVESPPYRRSDATRAGGPQWN